MVKFCNVLYEKVYDGPDGDFLARRRLAAARGHFSEIQRHTGVKRQRSLKN